jgi:hypothetical protein
MQMAVSFLSLAAASVILRKTFRSDDKSHMDL